MISAEYAEAFSQVLYVLEHMEQSLVDKIPKQVIRVLQENMSEDSAVSKEYTKSFGELNLSPKASSVLAIIYLNCLCTPDEKSEYIQMLKDNEKIYKSIENSQIGSDDIFNNFEQSSDNNIEKADMIVYKKDNLFVKLINIFKKIFKFK